MKRVAQVIELRPEKKELYLHLHQNVWSEVLETIHACNIQNYSIFLKDNLLFAYFEYVGDDYEKDMKKRAADPVTQDWWSVCKPCQKPRENRLENEWWTDLDEVFHT